MKKSFLEKYIYESDREVLYKIDSNFNNKNGYFIIEGEELFIEELIIPGVGKKSLENIMENEVLNRFQSIENITFDYIIKEKTHNRIRLFLYCVNIENLSLNSEKSYERINIISVDLVQNYFIRFYEKFITHNKYVIVMSFREYTYVCYVVDKILQLNKVFHNSNINFYEDLLEFYNRLYKKDNKTLPIYIVGKDYPLANFILKHRTLDDGLFYKYLKNFHVINFNTPSEAQFYEFIINKNNIKKVWKCRANFIQNGIKKEKKVTM